MYDEILLPTDGSDGAATAYDHALAVAERFDARVHPLYVVNTTYSDVGATGTPRSELRDRGEKAVGELADRASETGIDAVTHVVDGDPFREIRSFANAEADLIVMATRGRSGLDRYLLGSVTEKLVRTADVPVLTVRGGEEPP
ncbi:universal stress protein [Haloparvum sedimenti]|uniref:universal stress protein n=1 Tax=Haloparvum sedimenti TaxID=1678448 RepID=UPI00071E72FB|nr:universal stress protein [Haloparvum sedimenti]